MVPFGKTERVLDTRKMLKSNRTDMLPLRDIVAEKKVPAISLG